MATPPHNGVLGEHCPRFWGRRNYPQAGGTRPSAITSCLATLSQEAVAEPARSAPALADVPAPPKPLPPFTFTRAVELLDTIPGINQRGAEMIIAEIGIAMARFGTASRLAAWSGVAPGKDESAGKQ